MKENKIRVMDEGNQVLVTFTIPQQMLAMGEFETQGQFGQQDQFQQRNQFEQGNQFEQRHQFDQQAQFEPSNRFERQDRFVQRESRSQQFDQNQRSQPSDWETQSSWNMQSGQEQPGRWESRTTRSQWETSPDQGMRSSNIQPDMRTNERPSDWDARFESRMSASDPQFRSRMQSDEFSRERHAPTQMRRTDRFQTQDRFDTTTRFETRQQPSTFDSGAEFESRTQWREHRSPSTWQPSQHYRSQPSQRDSFSTQTFESGRIYGTGSQDRPIVLGIIMEDMDKSSISTLSSNYNQGVKIQRVNRGAPADLAGLREGDVIVLVDSKPATTQTLERRVTTAKSGEDMNLKVIRDGRERDVNVNLGTIENREFWTTSETILPEMPNVEHPGPLDHYRPTRPDTANDGRDGLRHNRTYNSYSTMSTREFDRPSSANVRTQTTTRTYNTREFDSPTYYRQTESPYYYERESYNMRSTRPANRTYNSGEFYRTDADFWDRGNEDLEMPNVEHPGPLNEHRPTRLDAPEVDPYGHRKAMSNQ
jgi:hypothetical protein